MKFPDKGRCGCKIFPKPVMRVSKMPYRLFIAQEYNPGSVALLPAGAGATGDDSSNTAGFIILLFRYLFRNLTSLLL